MTGGTTPVTGVTPLTGAVEGVELVDGMPITAIDGVSAGALHSGIRPSGRNDLSIVDIGGTVPAAGVFTSNRATAAPVVVSRQHLEATSGKARGFVANSGCANACTGERGVSDARAMSTAVAELFGCPPEAVLVASTGLIGTFLPIESVTRSISGARVETGEKAGHDAARAILTTDTVPKEVGGVVTAGSTEFKVVGMAKGAAMLAPSMATMLAFVVTDADVTPDALGEALSSAVSRTFNKILVDACQSTNDTVLAFATGGAANETIDTTDHPEWPSLEAGLAAVCGSLARSMVRDGEGATTMAHVRVTGAATDRDAELVARAICSSVLVRCSLYGRDPYWGRVASEAGASGASFDLSKLSIEYGGIRVCESGAAIDHDEDALAEHMESDVVEVAVDLGLGPGGAEMLTCDLGPGYIEENMGTS